MYGGGCIQQHMYTCPRVCCIAAVIVTLKYMPCHSMPCHHHFIKKRAAEAILLRPSLQARPHTDMYTHPWLSPGCTTC